MAYHPFLGERDGVMPIMPYHLKERLLESPVLKANGWTMEKVLQVEAIALSEELKKYELLGTEETRRKLARCFAVIEENVMSGNPTAVNIFGPIYKQLKDIPGIRNQENWWNEPVIVLADETLEPIEVPDEEAPAQISSQEMRTEDPAWANIFTSLVFMVIIGAPFSFVGICIHGAIQTSFREPYNPVLGMIIGGCVGAIVGFIVHRKSS